MSETKTVYVYVACMKYNMGTYSPDDAQKVKEHYEKKGCPVVVK